MSEAAVQVAVRVRPFNGREKSMNSKRCIDMDSNTTWVHEEDAEEADIDKCKQKFNFDFSLWSHFDMNNDALAGKCEDPDFSERPNVDQNVAYDMIGLKLLNYMWEGYDVCMFAYGQSGSGKSFSMTGTGPKCAQKWKGMIPRISADTFKRVKQESDSNISYKTTASMLEIYLDDIYDLLIPPESYNIKTRPALKMEMDTVNGLVELPVAAEEDVTDLLVRGFGNQTKAPTGLNVDSSRGHTIFTLDVNKKVIDPAAKKKAEREQIIHTCMKLVDLAGSERTEKVLEITKEQLSALLTQKYNKPITVSDEMMATYKAERTTEGRAINNSLTTLGNCVKAVAKISAIEDVKEREKQMNQISWRSSSLTRLLRTALNGKCKTIMIAAVSPSLSEYPETISTMRYASQIKAIKSMAKKKEAKQSAEQLAAIKIAELEAKLAAALSGGGGASGGKGSSEDATALKDAMAKLKAQEDELRRKDEEMALQMASIKAEQAKKDHIRESGVHLVEIVNNPMTSGLVPTELPNKSTLMAGLSSGPGVKMVLRGIGVRPNHCTFTINGDSVLLKPADDKAQCMRNGKLIEKDGVNLVHNDRIRLAENNYFRVINPKMLKSQSEEQILLESDKYNYEFLREEALRELVSGFQTAETAEEEQRRIAFEKNMDAKEKEFLAKEAALEAKYAKQQGDISSALSGLEKQLEALKKQNQELIKKASAAEKEKVISDCRAKEEALEEQIESKRTGMMKELMLKKLADQKQLNTLKKGEEKKLKKTSEKARQADAEKARIQYDLMEAIPAVRQANACAKEMHLSAKYDVKLISDQTPMGLKNEVCVQLTDDSNAVELWKIEKFKALFGIMTQQYYNWESAQKTGAPFELPPDSPYFVSHHTLQVIGHAKIMMSYIYNNMEINDKFQLVSYTGQLAGEVEVAITPLYTKEQKKYVESNDTMDSLPGEFLDMKIDIKSGSKLPPQYASDVRVEYSFPDFLTTCLMPANGKLRDRAKDEDEEEYNEKVGISRGAKYITPFNSAKEGVLDVNPVLGYSRICRVLNMNAKVIRWFEENELILTVSGEVPDSLQSTDKQMTTEERLRAKTPASPIAPSGAAPKGEPTIADLKKQLAQSQANNSKLETQVNELQRKAAGLSPDTYSKEQYDNLQRKYLELEKQKSGACTLL